MKQETQQRLATVLLTETCPESQTGESLNAARRESRMEPTGRTSGSPSDNLIPAISTEINFQEGCQIQRTPIMEYRRPV